MFYLPGKSTCFSVSEESRRGKVVACVCEYVCVKRITSHK